MPALENNSDERPSSGIAAHWDHAYSRGVDQVSWFESEAGMSGQLIKSLNLAEGSATIDIGGGASPLAGYLLDQGLGDVSVLDISADALDAAKAQLGSRGQDIQWIDADLLTWTPSRKYGLWHDRAVLHFLTQVEDQRTYSDLVRTALAPGGFAVIGAFALDGPESCSGLEVQRYTTGQLLDLLGETFSLVEERQGYHETPGGSIQHFSWIAARFDGR